MLLKGAKPGVYADRSVVRHDLEVTIRREAEKIARETGEPIEDLIAEIERYMEEARR